MLVFNKAEDSGDASMGEPDDVIWGDRTVAYVDVGLTNSALLKLHPEVAVQLIHLSIDDPNFISVQPCVLPIAFGLPIVAVWVLDLHFSARFPFPFDLPIPRLNWIVVTHFYWHALGVVLEFTGELTKFDLLAVLFLHEPVRPVSPFVHLFWPVSRPITDLVVVPIN